MPRETVPTFNKRTIPRTGPSKVIFNRNVGPNWFLLRLEEPQIARESTPGQFVQIGCSEPGSLDPLLRRPFSVYDVDIDKGTYDILYVVTGRGTRWMASLPQSGHTADGSEVLVDVIGPFGNRFTPPEPDSVVLLVGGGVGVAPLYFYARELCNLTTAKPSQIILCMGARSSAQLQGIDDFRQLPIRSEVATNDGSEGYSGFVTGLLESLLDGDVADVSNDRIRVYGCGPTGMNEALREVAVNRGLRCEICLESYMACGFGICFACVAPIAKEPGGELYNRRVCLEGPVFEAHLIGSGLGVL